MCEKRATCLVIESHRVAHPPEDVRIGRRRITREVEAKQLIRPGRRPDMTRACFLLWLEPSPCKPGPMRAHVLRVDFYSGHVDDVCHFSEPPANGFECAVAVRGQIPFDSLYAVRMHKRHSVVTFGARAAKVSPASGEDARLLL